MKFKQTISATVITVVSLMSQADIIFNRFDGGNFVAPGNANDLHLEIVDSNSTEATFSFTNVISQEKKAPGDCGKISGNGKTNFFTCLKKSGRCFETGDPTNLKIQAVLYPDGNITANYSLPSWDGPKNFYLKLNRSAYSSYYTCDL